MMRGCNRKLKKCSMSSSCNLNLSFTIIYSKSELRLSQVVLSWGGGENADSLIYSSNRLTYSWLCNFSLRKCILLYKTLFIFFVLVLFSLFCFVSGCVHSMWNFLGEGSNSHHSSSPSHHSDNARSLTCCSTREPQDLISERNLPTCSTVLIVDGQSFFSLFNFFHFLKLKY